MKENTLSLILPFISQISLLFALKYLVTLVTTKLYALCSCVNEDNPTKDSKKMKRSDRSFNFNVQKDLSQSNNHHRPSKLSSNTPTNINQESRLIYNPFLSCLILNILSSSPSPPQITSLWCIPNASIFIQHIFCVCGKVI